jgi:hypothetical protein
MQSPMRELSVPFRKRSWFQVQLAVGSMLIGWLWHRPTENAQIVISCLLGGLAVWFFLASPVVWYFGNHRIPIVRAITFVVAVVGLVFFMRTIIPYVHGLV